MIAMERSNSQVTYTNENKLHTTITIIVVLCSWLWSVSLYKNKAKSRWS